MFAVHRARRFFLHARGTTAHAGIFPSKFRNKTPASACKGSPSTYSNTRSHSITDVGAEALTENNNHIGILQSGNYLVLRLRQTARWDSCFSFWWSLPACACAMYTSICVRVLSMCLFACMLVCVYVRGCVNVCACVHVCNCVYVFVFVSVAQQLYWQSLTACPAVTRNVWRGS